MKHILILILIFISSITTAQNPRMYYKYTSKAEFAAIKGNYKKASKLYYKAFEHNFPFYTDLHHAVQCETLANPDSARLTRFILLKYQLSGGKISSDVFYNNLLKNEDFSNLKYRTSWKSMLDTIQFTDEHRYNPELSEKILKLRDFDQACRGEGFTDNATLDKTDSLNMIEVFKIFETHYPITESKIGISAMSALNLLLTHGLKTMDSTRCQILEKEISDGYYYNRYYSDIIDNYSIFGYPSDFGSFYLMMCNEKYLEYIPIKQISKRTNANRQALFMEKWQHQVEKKKWLWQQNSLNPEGPLWLFYRTTELSVPEESFSDFIDKFKHKKIKLKISE